MAVRKAIKKEREREREMGKKWYAVGRKWWLGILSPVTRTRPRVRARGRSRSSRKGEPIGAENTLRDTGWPFFTLRSALHPRPPPIPRSTLLFAPTNFIILSSISRKLRIHQFQLLDRKNYTFSPILDNIFHVLISSITLFAAKII